MYLDSSVFTNEMNFPADTASLPQRQQIDPVYLGALLELGKVEGLSKLLDASKFTAKVFDKTLWTVIEDACRECASEGYSFGCNK